MDTKQERNPWINRTRLWWSKGFTNVFTYEDYDYIFSMSIKCKSGCKMLQTEKLKSIRQTTHPHGVTPELRINDWVLPPMG